MRSVLILIFTSFYLMFIYKDSVDESIKYRIFWNSMCNVYINIVVCLYWIYLSPWQLVLASSIYLFSWTVFCHVFWFCSCCIVSFVFCGEFVLFCMWFSFSECSWSFGVPLLRKFVFTYCIGDVDLNLFLFQAVSQISFVYIDFHYSVIFPLIETTEKIYASPSQYHWGKVVDPKRVR